MFNSVFGLKGIAIASIVALAIGTGIGWTTRDAFCDAAAQRAKVAQLENDKAFLELQLTAERAVSELAAKERARLRLRQAELDEKAATYEAMLILAPPAEAAACRITADDLRFRDSLRKPAGAR